MKRAYVEVDTERLRENYKKIKTICSDVSFIFPVKCCGNEKILQVIRDCADGFDVSNENEYKKIELISYGKIVCASGPLSFQLIGRSGVYVSINSLSRWEKGCGIRVNFNDDDRFEKSHFGVSFSNITSDMCNSVKYVHFHNSDYRTKEKCEIIVHKVEKIVSKFPKMECLNIGGHLGELDFNEAALFINAIRNVMPIEKRLIIEAGDFFISNCGKLYCEVEDSFIQGKNQTVFLNFSKVAQQRWVHPKISFSTEAKETVYNTSFLGISCCEGDVFHRCLSPKIDIGEKLVFENISTYSYEWNQSFNGTEKLDFRFI